jgi:uncharacterized protein
VRWYRKASDAGEGRGMGHLGYMYEIGAGVSEDALEAVRWYARRPMRETLLA